MLVHSMVMVPRGTYRSYTNPNPNIIIQASKFLPERQEVPTYLPLSRNTVG
jgi:hypothetical protein